ncbi:MAG TPA: hypothetical protein VNW29_06950 [Candidatus Sulfotelmatobacter sp.]|jgi:hypothetical protein|nr:hypothetical protein [Candidatus Sulfotelmatobacter sp.]
MNSKQYDKREKVLRKLTVERANLGKAGEFLVAGKLLLNGFNVYNGAIDDGIDLVARKRRKFYYIQVKTCQDIDYDSGKFMAKINLSTLSKYPHKNTFVVLVLHFLGPTTSLDFMGDHTKYDQDYIVLPVNKLISFFQKETGDITFRIYYSILMDLPQNTHWIAKLKYNKRELILDDFMLDSFWQIEI